MMPLVLIVTAVLLPVLLALVLRVNAVMLFLAVAVGALLERAAGDSAELALAMVSRSETVSYIAHIGVLLLPVLLTLFFLRKTAKRNVLIGLLPLFATSFALSVLILGLLPPHLQQVVYGQPFGAFAKQSSDLAITVAAILNLALAWRTHSHKHDGGHH